MRHEEGDEMVGRVGQVQAAMIRGKGHPGVTISDESRPPVRITVGFATREDAERARALLVEAFSLGVAIQGAR
jgi:hypothetical protein